MILVTGATGPFGLSAIKHLLHRGVQPAKIAALVRSPEKASALSALNISLVAGDYNNPESLKQAFNGIEKLLFVSGNDINNRKQQHGQVLTAAVEASVTHIVYTSFYRKDDALASPIAPIAESHISTETGLQQSGVPYTILRNALYADILPMFLGEHFAEKGIFLPTGNGTVPYVLRAELAEAAANALLDTGHKNAIYDAVNTTNYSFTDIAQSLSQLLRKEITYTDPGTEVFRQVLSGAGLPAEAIDGIVMWTDAIKGGYFAAQNSDMEKLLGRKPASLEQMMQHLYGN